MFDTWQFNPCHIALSRRWVAMHSIWPLIFGHWLHDLLLVVGIERIQTKLSTFSNWFFIFAHENICKKFIDLCRDLRIIRSGTYVYVGFGVGAASLIRLIVCSAVKVEVSNTQQQQKKRFICALRKREKERERGKGDPLI